MLSCPKIGGASTKTLPDNFTPPALLNGPGEDERVLWNYAPRTRSAMPRGDRAAYARGGAHG